MLLLDCPRVARNVISEWPKDTGKDKSVKVVLIR